MWLAPSSFCPPEEKNFNLTLSWNKPFPPWVAFIWIFCLSKRKEVKTQLWERVAWFSMAFIVSSEQTTVSLSFCFKIGEPEKNIIDHWLIVNAASWIAPTYCQNYCASHLLGRRDMCGTKYFKMLAVFPSWDPTLLFHFYVNIIFLISREESKWLFFVLEQHALCRDLHVDSAHVNWLEVVFQEPIISVVFLLSLPCLSLRSVSPFRPLWLMREDIRSDVLQHLSMK